MPRNQDRSRARAPAIYQPALQVLSLLSLSFSILSLLSLFPLSPTRIRSAAGAEARQLGAHRSDEALPAGHERVPTGGSLPIPHVQERPVQSPSPP